MVKQIVIDNSALVPLFMPDESSVLMEEIVKLTAEGTRLLSPSFVAVEFGNTMLTGMKRGRLTRSEVEFAHSQFYELPIQLIDFVGRPTIPTIHAMALQQGLSFYDALYLALAVEEGAALASNDEDLNTAAKAMGVQVLNPGQSSHSEPFDIMTSFGVFKPPRETEHLSPRDVKTAMELAIARQAMGIDKDD